jgi:hypothetical protein
MKGFFSFIIILLIIIFLINFSIFRIDVNSEKNDLLNTLIEIEQSSKERTIMENNIDRIITTKLSHQFLEEDFRLEKTKNNINSKIFNYLKNKSKISSIYFDSEEQITLSKLNSMSSVWLTQIDKIKFATYEFTSNTNKNKIISQNFGTDFDLYFKIPINYKISVVIFDA